MRTGIFVSLILFLFNSQNVFSQSALPEGEGSDIVEDVCTMCHDLTNITDSNRSPEQWRFVVNQMVMQGAPLQDYEVDTVVEYLSNSFGIEQ
jgi:hypothetical protein